MILGELVLENFGIYGEETLLTSNLFEITTGCSYWRSQRTRQNDVIDSINFVVRPKSPAQQPKNLS